MKYRKTITTNIMSKFYWVVACSVLLSVNGWAAKFNPLPDTGQHRCYNSSGDEITCPPPGNALAQDGSYDSTEGKTQQFFIDNGDGTVTDNNTGLIWMKATADLNGDNIINNSDQYSWQAAKDFCENLNLAGYSDWRLPELIELTTLLDYGRYQPAINLIFSCEPSYYWSATPDAYNSEGYAWGVHFDYGHGYVKAKSNLSYIRCVHGEPSGPLNNYTDNGDGTTTSMDTGLMWQATPPDLNSDHYPDKMSWGEALSYCENLTLAGYNDWRLPDIQEIRSFVNYNNYDPFPFPYWSATTYLKNPIYAWGIDLGHGDVGFGGKSGLSNVRCVRSGLIRLPLPEGTNVFDYQPDGLTIKDNTPSNCEPIDFKVINGVLNLLVDLPVFTAPVDLYLGIYAPAINPSDVILIINNGTAIDWMQNGLKTWNSNVLKSISNSMGLIDLNNLPAGNYIFYLLAVPANNSSFTDYYLWSTTYVKN